jgi:Zn-dependent protease with chaperone function
MLKPNDRVYKSKIKVYSDILYFTSDILYFIWIIVMMFFSFKLASLLILLVILRWFLLDPFKEKQDMSYVVLKLIVLSIILIS